MPVTEIVNGVEKQVKNLGYVIDKVREEGVSDIEVAGTKLVVHYCNGDEHRSDWADASVMANWLRSRRSWMGTPISFNGRDGVLSSTFPAIVWEKR